MGLLKATFNGINIKLRLNKDLQYYINACNLRHFLTIFMF